MRRRGRSRAAWTTVCPLSAPAPRCAGWAPPAAAAGQSAASRHRGSRRRRANHTNRSTCPAGSNAASGKSDGDSNKSSRNSGAGPDRRARRTADGRASVGLLRSRMHGHQRHRPWKSGGGVGGSASRDNARRDQRAVALGAANRLVSTMRCPAPLATPTAAKAEHFRPKAGKACRWRRACGERRPDEPPGLSRRGKPPG